MGILKEIIDVLGFPGARFVFKVASGIWESSQNLDARIKFRERNQFEVYESEREDLDFESKKARYLTMAGAFLGLAESTPWLFTVMGIVLGNPLLVGAPWAIKATAVFCSRQILEVVSRNFHPYQEIIDDASN